MISEQAGRSVNQLFVNAARGNLAMAPGDSVEIVALPESRLIEPPGETLVVLTVASYLFRLLTVFHVESKGPAARYFDRAESGRPFGNVFGEIGNLCCGAMNRELGKHFPHLGMSTPYELGCTCFPFLAELKPGYLSQHRIEINGAPMLHATLCLCAWGDIDFRVDAAAVEESCGELELF
ncbi:MAG: hypothetical protein QM739_17095 [Propionivibrio sp.]